jgi:hypothetical protein
MSEIDTLSTQQRRALECLLTTRTLRKAAEQSDTPERTLSRWLYRENTNIYALQLAEKSKKSDL